MIWNPGRLYARASRAADRDPAPAHVFPLAVLRTSSTTSTSSCLPPTPFCDDRDVSWPVGARCRPRVPLGDSHQASAPRCVPGSPPNHLEAFLPLGCCRCCTADMEQAIQSAELCKNIHSQSSWSPPPL